MSSKSSVRVGSDGLPLLEEGDWSKQKFDLVARYAAAFNVAVHKKFQNRVYIDLFSGTGLVGIEGSLEQVEGCAFRAMNSVPSFTHHVLCELVPDYMTALKARVQTHKGPLYSKCSFIEGDSNLRAADVVKALPKPSRTNKLLAFCLVDPFGTSGFKFETIKTINQIRTDFLVLVPTGMDLKRNENLYLKKPEIVDAFLGDSSWRSSWLVQREQGKDFGAFMLESFGESMKKLGYIFNGADKAFRVVYPPKNFTLYHMAYFSKHDLGAKLYMECKKYMTSQQSLF